MRTLLIGVLSALALFSANALAAELISGGQIQTISVVGAKRIDPETLVLQSGLERGEQLTGQRASQALASIHKGGFVENAAIYSRLLEGGGMEVVLQVEERPLIDSIDFDGNEELADKRLKELLKIKERQVYSRTTVDEAVVQLSSRYHKDGYFLVRIETMVKPLPDNRVALVFNIREGDKTRIRKVDIIGNHQFDDVTLLKSVDSQPMGFLSFFSSSGVYERQKLLNDVEKLRAFYMDRGHFDFELGTPQVMLTPDLAYMDITFDLTEGEVYTIGDIDMTGDYGQPKSELMALVGFKSGDLFSRSKVGQTIQKLTEAVADLGYAYTNVNPMTQVDEEHHRVSFTFDIHKGERVYYRRIEIVGNSKTSDSVIRREMRINEAEKFSFSKLRRSRERVQRLGYFESVDLNTPRVDGVLDQTDVIIDVAERSTGQVSVGMGYSSVDKVIGQASIQENNLFGRGQSLKVSTQFSISRMDYNLSFTEPYLFNQPTSMSTSLYNTRTLNNNSSSVAIRDYDQLTRGASISLGKELSEYLHESVSYGLSNTVISNVGSNAPQYIKAGTVSTGVLGHAISWDTRNSTMFATDGGLQVWRFEYAGIGGNSHFFRSSLETSDFIPLDAAENWVGSIHARYGRQVATKTGGIPYIERYQMGGGSSVRGFQYYSLGAKDSNNVTLGGTTEVLANIELLTPVPLLSDAGFKGVFFADAGQVFQEHDRVDPKKLRRSVGIGLRWMSPVGPLRFEWSFPQGVRSGDNLLTFEFNMGGMMF